MIRKVCVLQLCLSTLVCRAQSGHDPRGTPMKFTTPELSDEETHSQFMPDLMQCDACNAIAYTMWNRFDKFNSVHKKYKYNLPESEIYDLTEAACDRSEYNSYGLKLVNEKKRLTGPGTEAENHPGIMQGGGKWPYRMATMCQTFMEKVGETEMYEEYKKRRTSRPEFLHYLCNGSGILGKCSNIKDEL